MATIEILQVVKDTIVKTGERFLNVQAQIVDGKKKHPRNFGFNLETTTDEIEAELEKALLLYEDEKAQAAANAETDKAEANADETIAALEGVSITSE